LVVVEQNKPKDTAIQELLDKHEIQEILMRYCRSVDRMDWETVRSCYHPDAIDDHGFYSGQIDGFIEFFSNWASKQYQCAMHLIGNVLIEVQGNQAVSESYSITHLRLSKERALHPDFRKLWDSGTGTEILDDKVTAVDVTLGLRMVDRFERRTNDGPWLINHRVIVHEWDRLDPVHFQLNVSSTMRQGVRDQTDLIFERLVNLQHDSNAGK
jgi:hypothetical protein